MDNQLFPGGTYLDDMPQVCTLCGAVLNNTRSLYSHMQLHILSSNLGAQPPDPGLALNTANILDLLTAGVSQQLVPSSVPAPILTPQSLFTPVSTVPTRLITPSLDLGLAAATLQSLPVHHPPVKTKEKKSSQSKSQSQSTTSHSSGSARTTDNSSSFMPSFTTKESKKHEEPSTSHSKPEGSSTKDPFQLANKFESVDDPLGLASVSNKPLLERERKSVSRSKASQETAGVTKDVKLFQPFVTTETTTSSSQSFLPKSNHFHATSGLKSPPRSPPEKSIKDVDVLNTPQKMNQHVSDLRTEDIILPVSDPSIPTTLAGGEGRQSSRGKSQDGNRGKSQEMLDSLFDKMKETPAPPPKTPASQSDTHLPVMKTQFYPGILDPLNVSPKSTQVFKRDSSKEMDAVAKITPQPMPFSSKPPTTFSSDSVLSNSSQNQTTPMVSPKIDSGIELPGSSDSVSNPPIFESRENVGSAQSAAPPPMFGNAPSTSGIPPPVGRAPLRSSSPPVLGHTDPTKNPLGTGFFNALTQKLINPSLSIVTDFTKTPSTSTFNNFGGDSSSKGYYENGVLLNHDYDKISDTNDEDDLDRLIDIDPKVDTNIDSKSIDIIDDILNEFNERTEDANKGNRNQLFDVYNVLDEGSKSKSDGGKTDFLSDENTKSTTSFIDELLEKEKEQIDREMRESAITVTQAPSPGSVSTATVTCTASTVTFSTTSTASSTVSSVGFTNSALGSAAGTGKNLPDPTSDKKKEDDNIDFEIPKVGKLMKIRKYFESQEQKKKEQTQTQTQTQTQVVVNKDTEIKIQEKKEPVVEEKPQLQTILVQVSKRKKIEYGPYINRQSLLEGKPKEAEAGASTASSPLKLFRPKPRPQVPTRRTFNLRTRKTKTDFASLANKGSRISADGKRVNEKDKMDGKDKDKSVSKDSSKDMGGEENKCEEDKDSKIVTRNKAAKKDLEKSPPVKVTGADPNKRTLLSGDPNKRTVLSGDPNKRTVLSGDPNKRTVLSGDPNKRTVLDGDPNKRTVKSDHKEKQDPNKHTLRTRSTRGELTESEKQESEGKSLRRRVLKPSGEESGKVVKITKSSESDDNSKKVLRSKLKTTPEKNDIKKCSVNLGENLSGSKLKAAAHTNVDGKEKQKVLKLETSSDKLDINMKTLSDTSDVVDVEEQKEVIVNDEKESVIDLEIKSENHESRVSIKAEKCDEIDCIAINDNETTEVKTENPTEEDKSVKSQSAGKNSQTQANIFDVMSANIVDENKVKPKPKPKAENIQPVEKKPVEKKVQVIKLKLGSEIQKSLKEIKESLSLSKKKRFEAQKDDLQRELDTCTKRVSEIQRQIESHKEAESLKRNESFNGEKKSRSVLNEDEESTSKKLKHSVENEFQRLVNEAVAEAKKSEKSDSAKPERYVNLRKRLNESVNYNVDISDNEVESNLTYAIDPGASTPKSRKLSISPKGSKFTPSKFSPKFQTLGKFQKASLVTKPVKKDVDVYDFTDTEMSDKEDSTPIKLSSFKPKYVSNVGSMGSKFLSKSFKTETDIMQPFESSKSDDNADNEVSYVGKTVEPLKIKLTKIIPYTKEKKHKHKKKKRKKDKERKKFELSDDDDNDADDDDDESKDSMDIDRFNDKSDDSDSMEGVEKDLDTVGNHQGSKKSKLKTKNHICAFCNQAFSQKCDLKKHEMIHTGERPWPCEICDKKFLRKTDLAKHIRTHTGEKPYKCEFCDKRVSDKSQLNVHRRLHTGSRPYRCTQCGKGCITSSELTRHRSVHCTETSHKCELCNKVFKVKEYLGMHMKLHYKSRGKPFKCNKCALGFDKQEDFERHKCANANPSLFICSECYGEFTEELTYAEHIKTHDLDVFSCNICTNIFEDKHSLETHLCTMGVVEQPKQFPCEFCDKIFPDQGSLARHVPEHDNDVGQFMCENCPQIFTVRKEFLVHSRKHHGANVFICKCGTGFHDNAKAESHRQTCPVYKPKDKPHDSLRSSASVSGVTPTQHTVSNLMYKHDRHTGLSDKGQAHKMTRVSVISANVNFKGMDSASQMNISPEGFYNPHSATGMDMGLQNVYVGGGGAGGKPPGPGGHPGQGSAGGNKLDILDNLDKFEPVEFTHSPDFSSLTDDGSLTLGLNPFQKKSNFNSSGDKVGAQNELSESQEKMDVLSPERDGRKQKQFQNITSNLQSSHNSAQSNESQWIGSYQMSANDYVNSLLNKMDTDTGSSTSSISAPGARPSVKVENNQFTDTYNKFQSSNRMEFKDNIANESKGDIFSEFDFSVSSNQKDLYQSASKQGMDASKFNADVASSSQAGAEFQDVNQTSFMSNPQQPFPEKTDFSAFSSPFLGFPPSSSFSLSGSGSLFGGTGQGKQSTSNNLFTAGQDLIHNSFFLGVEESMKGTLPTGDKSDDTAALLSNFDYDLN